MQIEELAHFLDAANKATYANETAPKAAATRPGSNDYRFEQGDLTYHDTYFGSRDFIGSEVVYKAGVPEWGMNYYGYIIDDEADKREIYSFLRTVLRQAYKNIIPVRGPEVYRKEEWQYSNKPIGTLERFTGEETISKSGTMLYRCVYSGGWIKD
jgi:hypothetical protein